MTPYDHDFYGAQAAGSERSADAVLPVVFELLRPTSVVDVGCGVGTWLAAAQRLGVDEVRGLDGAYAIDAGLRIPKDPSPPTELAVSLPAPVRRFDLAMSLEVAEHLPAARSDSFVADLCALADVVLFSAAIPGQLGTDHITLEFQHTWADRFGGNGYLAFDIVRPRVWHDADVEAFYRQNALVFVNSARSDLVSRAAELVAANPPMLDVVHPELLAFWVRRATRPVSTSQALRHVGTSAKNALRRRFIR